MLEEHDNRKILTNISITLAIAEVHRLQLKYTKQYISFKDNLNFEKYLINVSTFYYFKIIKYGTGNHRLPINDDIPLNERKCKICTTYDIGDEDKYHYLFTCDFSKSDRKLYLKLYFYVKPSIRKYRERFISTNEARSLHYQNLLQLL